MFTGARAETTVLRSGNGSIGGADSLVHGLAGPADAPFAASFPGPDFESARSVPDAFVVDKAATAIDLAGASESKWTSASPSTDRESTAPYAIDFELSDPFSATTLDSEKGTKTVIVDRLRILVPVALGFIPTLSLVNESRADYVIDMIESGGDVIATGSGTINTAGLQYYTTPGNIWSLVDAGKGNVILGAPFSPPNPGPDADYYLGLTGPTDFGSDAPFWFADEGGGDTVGVTFPLVVVVPVGYISGSALSSNATWFGKTFTDLGLTPGTSYTWTWGSGDTADSFTLNVGAQAVPEPTSLVMLGMGTLALVGHARRRRRAAA